MVVLAGGVWLGKHMRVKHVCPVGHTIYAAGLVCVLRDLNILFFPCVFTAVVAQGKRGVEEWQR